MAHQHLHAHAAREANPDIATIVSVVYVTATPTFSGAVGGYSTMNGAQSAPAGPDFFDAGSASVNAPSSVPHGVQQVMSSATDVNVAAVSTSNAIPQSTYHINHAPPSGIASAASSQTTLISSVIAGGGVIGNAYRTSAASSSGLASITPASSASIAQNNAAPTAASEPATSSGLSGGAKGGIAFVIILAVALVMAAAFLFYRRNKKQNDGHEKIDDEKSGFQHNNSNASISSHVSVRRKDVNTAPRLSLRPVTELFPEMAEKQAAAGHNNNNGMLSASTASRGITPVSAVSDANPFNDPMDALNEKNGPGPAETSPFTDAAAVAPRPLNVAEQRQAPPNANRQSPPGGMPPVNVHRVQMDFTPSMEDELELKMGQVVRLIHEYDDGWALCKRLDRSQQGVVPRTCLSRLPVKPRPAGPPPPGMRGVPPQGRPRQGSAAQRPMGPPGAGRPRAPSNAPGSPASSTSSSSMTGAPAPLNTANRSRANSAAATAAKRMTPPSGTASPEAGSPNGAMPARKPVPGQAL